MPDAGGAKSAPIQKYVLSGDDLHEAILSVVEDWYKKGHTRGTKGFHEFLQRRVQQLEGGDAVKTQQIRDAWQYLVQRYSQNRDKLATSGYQGEVEHFKSEAVWVAEQHLDEIEQLFRKGRKWEVQQSRFLRMEAMLATE